MPNGRAKRLVKGDLHRRLQKDGLFGGAVVPRWQWVLGFRAGCAPDNERPQGDS
jgi:hypothetical protein